ncbi:MAG: aldo/keto reductase, partial [Armatimonadota bacterium]
GHWKRVNLVAPGCFEGGNWLGVDLEHEGFRQNRHDVVSRCIERGINYIDACTWQEVMAYSEALRGRRDSMHLGFSWYQEEMRNGKFRTTEALLGTLDKGMSKAGLDYVDVWRITMHEQSSKHTEAEVEQMMGALAKAREQGKARFTGFSSHDRPHIKWMIETYPEVVDVAVTPFTVKSKERPTDSLFDAVRQYGVGVFGIKPFGGTSLFKGDSTPDNVHAKEDDEIARMTIRYILATEAITAPIPGLITPEQVDNVALAVRERRELDLEEQARLERAGDEMHARLPSDYQWLKDWEWV